MEQLKLVSVTVVLTLLIWTTAHQLVSETAEIEVIIRPAPTGGGAVRVETDPPGLDHFRLTVTGPKRVVDRVRDLVRARELPPLSVTVPDHLEGPQTVDMHEALSRAHDQLLGLRIDKVDPPEVKVIIDHLQTVTMPVHLDGGLLECDVPPQAEPAEVAVTLPSSVLDRLAVRRVPLAVEGLLRDKPEGEPLEIPGVPLAAKLGGAQVSIDPPTVTVRATLRKRSKTGTIMAVPITIQASVETFNRFRVETRDGRTLISRAITVQGAPAVVDALVAGRTAVTGRIVVTGDTAAQAGQFIELQPVFDLPPEVRLGSPVAPVELRLAPLRDEAGP